jgi:hypothetical protein
MDKFEQRIEAKRLRDEVAVEAWRRQLASLQWMPREMFSMLHRAADDFRVELEQFTRSITWYKVSDRATEELIQIPLEQRMQQLRVEQLQQRLRENVENAIWRVDGDFQKERLKVSKKLNAFLRLIDMYSAKSAAYSSDSVNRVSDGFALDLRWYAAAVEKAGNQMQHRN